jgi:hypothetical protein
MQIKRIIKSRIAFSGLAVFISFFMLLSTANAVVDHERPDWWLDANARIVFSPLGYEDITDPLFADGLGYKYTVHFNVTGNSVLSQTYMHIDLQNKENLHKIKLFWVGFHYLVDPSIGEDFLPNETFVDIIGNYNDNTQTGSIPFDYFNIEVDQDGSGWAYFAASLFPQPASEEFIILVDTFLMGDQIFQIDQIEIGTKCVPIPSALILFGGGLAGLVGIRRRKQK